jgi:DNA repair exonuclease SbcCD ATPase subunit
MPKKLDNLVIRGIAMVDRGANQHAKVLFSKRAGGDVADAELTAKLADAEAKLKAANDELAALKVSGGVTSDLDTLKKQHADAEKALTKERAELQEQLAKRTKEVEDARSEVAKIKSQRRRENFIKRAHELTGLPGAPADDFAEILDHVEAGLHAVVPDKAEKEFGKLNQLLTSWNAIVGKSAILQEVGRTTVGAFRGAAAQLDHLAKELQASDPKLTYAKAYEKVMLENPELYRKYQTEQES